MSEKEYLSLGVSELMDSFRNYLSKRGSIVRNEGSFLTDDEFESAFDEWYFEQVANGELFEHSDGLVYSFPESVFEGEGGDLD